MTHLWLSYHVHIHLKHSKRTNETDIDSKTNKEKNPNQKSGTGSSTIATIICTNTDELLPFSSYSTRLKLWSFVT